MLVAGEPKSLLKGSAGSRKVIAQLTKTKMMPTVDRPWRHNAGCSPGMRVVLSVCRLERSRQRKVGPFQVFTAA